MIALYKCCDAMYTAAEKSPGGSGKKGEGTTSTACPMRDVVRRRMRGMVEKEAPDKDAIGSK